MRLLKRLHKKLFKKPYLKSYSQCGEDMIVNFIFNALKIKEPSYLDIGAHHPTFLSNTAYFYDNGLSGVCIEPDPTLFEVIKSYRHRDVCLNIGIGLSEQAEADFYIMSSKSLNTFSKEEAESLSTTSQKIAGIIKIPLVPIDEIIKKYFDHCPSFVSLDVEGLELEILETFDFNQYRPVVFCIETLTYSENNTEQKESHIIEFMNSHGYMNYADTYINTIFVDKDQWINR